MDSPKRPIHSWIIALMIVVIVASLQMMTACAVYGYALLTFYLIAALCFFIPCLTIVCELTTSYPVTGGSYIWVEKAFGKSWGFFAVCIQWLCNIIWYPTIFSFIATAIAYLFDPELASNKIFMFWTVLGLFWGVTFINAWGIKVSSWVSAMSAIVGVILPIVLLIILGIVWISMGHPTAIHLTFKSLIPSLGDSSHLAFLTQVVISLIGLEMALVHAGDVSHPRKTLPRALFYAGCLVLFLVIAAPLTIVQVIPPEKIGIVSGLLDAFAVFFHTLGLPAFILIGMTALIFIGNWGSVTAWMISSTRGMHVACQKCEMPAVFVLTNRFHAPLGILLIEGLIFSFLSVLLTSFPEIGEGYWFLLILACQIALMYYWLIFAAALRLRKEHVPIPGAYQVPGKSWGIKVAAGIASLTVAVAILFGFFPPQEGSVHYEGTTYTMMLLCGIAITFIIPVGLLFLAKRKTRKISS